MREILGVLVRARSLYETFVEAAITKTRRAHALQIESKMSEGGTNSAKQRQAEQRPTKHSWVKIATEVCI